MWVWGGGLITATLLYYTCHNPAIYGHLLHARSVALHRVQRYTHTKLPELYIAYWQPQAMPL